MNTSGELNPDLESFREQWRAEVRARTNAPGNEQQKQSRRQSQSSSKASAAVPERIRPLAAAGRVAVQDNDDGYVPGLVFDDAVPDPTEQTSQSDGQQDQGLPSEQEPVTAVEYYERAVEKEAQGSLGDSLRLYRKAFRMDHRVDQKFKNKHFPAPPPSKATPTPAAATSSAKESLHAQPQSMKDLIAGFAELSIQPAAPEIEGMDPPPCPIANLPEELLVHILQDVAVLDVGDFVRLAQVCKRFAWLAATEERIWRRVCLGTEFGFGGMHYHWQRDVSWGPLGDALLLDDSPDAAARRHEAEALAATNTALRSAYASSWLRMFRQRPRVRFNGCYISTVNYIRSGQANANQITWNSPVHIVTYYRYLRLFRDGTAVSLLTTDEPAAVVHHLNREALALHRDGSGAHLPSAVVRGALWGRWRLSSAQDDGPPGGGADPKEAEGDLFIETEGVGPKYMYSMELSLASVGRGGAARNNKLLWKGFYSYNKLTDDWSEFGLKHYKPFFFSRVKSYGMGE